MVSTRNKMKQNETPPISNYNPPPLSNLFHTLVSAAAAAPNGLKPSLLKKLYYLLVELSRNQWSCMEVGTDLVQLNFEIVPSGMRVTSKDMCRLSDILFKEFCKRFKQLYSALRVSSTSEGNKQAISHPDMLASVTELNLHLRCCLKTQDLLTRQNIHDENGRCLSLIVRTLIQLVFSGESSISLENSNSSKINYGNDGSTNLFAEGFVAFICSLELTDLCIPVMSSFIEVFVDELSVSEQLGGYFSKFDYVSSTSYELSMDYLGDCDLKIMMELICVHFFLFISNEEDIENLFSRLSWPYKDFLAPEMSVTAALSLLHKPHMLCLPKIIQTHMISLVSEAIGFNLDFDHSIPDLKLIDHYLSTFRRSVVLYADNIAKLQIDGCPEHNQFYFLKSNISGRFFQVFESCIQPATRDKISKLNTNFSDSWNSHYRDRFLRSKDDISTSAITYMKENLCILDRCCRDEILAVLSYIIRRVSDDIDSVVFDCDDESIQAVCFLTSLVKLMSISLLQSLWCLRSTCIGCPTSENLSSCKEYQCIASIIDCFTAQDINLPIKNSLCNQIESQLTKHKKSKLMLFHFLRLLSFSFLSGVDFLANGCILCIMAIMNLFVFEEGNLGALKSLVDIGYRFPQQAARGDISTSLVVATKFQKTQSLYLSKIPPANFMRTEDGQLESCSFSSDHDNLNAVATVEKTQKTCNGVNYLECIGEKSSIDDLADFIECKEGKDYSSWLKDRDKYRKWKCEKHAALMLKKKKHAWTRLMVDGEKSRARSNTSEGHKIVVIGLLSATEQEKLKDKNFARERRIALGEEP